MDCFFSKLTQGIDPSSFTEPAQPTYANRPFNIFCSAQQLHRSMEDDLIVSVASPSRGKANTPKSLQRKHVLLR